MTTALNLGQPSPAGLPSLPTLQKALDQAWEELTAAHRAWVTKYINLGFKLSRGVIPANVPECAEERDAYIAIRQRIERIGWDIRVAQGCGGPEHELFAEWN